MSFVYSSGIAVKADTPVSINNGYTASCSDGIRNASTDNAAAGGINAAVFFIIINTITVVAATAINSYIPSIADRYLVTVPVTAQAVMTEQTSTGLFRAFEPGFQNSVNATSSGGATISLQPVLTAMIITMLPVSQRISISVMTILSGKGSGVNVLTSDRPK